MALATSQGVSQVPPAPQDPTATDGMLDLQQLSELVEDSYARDKEGEDNYSKYATKGGWSLADYDSPGFAHYYTVNKFVVRADAAFELVQAATQKFQLEMNDAQIFDLGAGPGCAAAGVAKHLWEKQVEPQVTLLDPCREWVPCIGAFQRMGLEAEFEVCQTLIGMVEIIKIRQKSEVPMILILSHVMKTFKPANLQVWWKTLQAACSKKKTLVLILEAQGTNMTGFLPDGQPDRRILLRDQLPVGSSSRSCGAAFIWNWPVGRPSHPVLLTNPATRMGPVAYAYPAQSQVCPKGFPVPTDSQRPLAPRSRVPQCPKCMSNMVVRTNKKGYNPGSKFWGCQRYPDCTGKRNA